MLLTSISEVITNLKTTYNTDFIVTGGDFNLTPDEWLDRLPSKYDSYCYNKWLMDLKQTNSLIDIWRDRNPYLQQFPWLKPNGSARSRTDLRLISHSMVQFASSVSISTAPLTDYCLNELVLESRKITLLPYFPLKCWL